MNIIKDKASLQTIFQEGNKLNQEKKTAQAVEKYLEVLKINPNFVPALNQLGSIYANTKEYDKAIHYFQRVVQLTQHSMAQARIALLMMTQGNIKEALTIYQKAIALKPQLPSWVHNYVGDMLIEAGWKKEAIS